MLGIALYIALSFGLWLIMTATSRGLHRIPMTSLVVSFGIVAGFVGKHQTPDGVAGGIFICALLAAILSDYWLFHRR